MLAIGSYDRLVFRLAGADKKYVMKIILTAFFVFLFMDSAGAVLDGFSADGDPSEWGPSGFLTGDWSVNDTWVPNPGIQFVVEDNYNPKAGGSYTGVHIQGNGNNYVFYDEPKVKLFGVWPVWEPLGGELYDIEAMYFSQDNNYIYLLIVTSQNWSSTGYKAPGDLRIDINKTLNSTDGYVYELGVKFGTQTGLTQSNLYEVSDWGSSGYFVPDNYPSVIVNGTNKGSVAGFAYTKCNSCNSGTGMDEGKPVYIVELQISKSQLGLSSGSYVNPSDISLVTSCTNESIRIVDFIPPASITNLQNATYFSRFINWTWNDPNDADFSHVMVYLNGVFQTNVSAGVEYYLATGLNPETSYTISTRTVDVSGNINQTWVNHTATTAPLPDEVWVDDDWAGSSPGEEVEAGKFFGYNAFAVIQDGVDNVNAGGTVHVRAGTYYEMITVDKSLTLLGAQADVDPRPSNGGRTGPESVIDAYGNYSAVFIDADNVVVNGFEITNATGDMVNQTATHSGTIVKYNYIHDSASPGDDGVQLKHCTDCVIEYNYFENILQDAANIASDSYNGSISYNEINGSYSENAAIFTYRSTDIDVIGNLVYNIYVNDGIKVGDYRQGDWNYGGVVRDNVVHDGVEDGITIYASNVTVEFNEIYNCSSRNGALHLYNATNAYVKCNKIHDNQANGTLIEDSQNVTLINNDIYNNCNNSFTTAGIWTVGDVRSFTANYNNIYNNSDYGFYNANSSITVNAENNWWGASDGPGGAGSGSGDAVSSYVDYSPWLSTSVIACVAGMPSITSYSPTSPVSDIEGATRTFNITINQTVNVYWYINGTPVQTNTTVTSASYTNTSAVVGYWNVTAIASNANGDDIQTWFWNVSPVVSPGITSFSPTDTTPTNSPGDTRTFSVTTDQIVTVTWYINGTQVQQDVDVNFSSYTNASAVEGYWNVTAIVSNANGTDSQTWWWTISAVDIIPPASITNLHNTTYGSTYINWTWNNPPDADFSHVMVYIDGIFVENTSNNFYAVTGLSPDTSYTISTHTVDTSGNINQTWVNHTAKTSPAPLNLYFPHVHDGSGWRSYFSVMNTGSSDANVHIRFYDNNRILVKDELIALAPSEKFSNYPRNVLGSDFVGIIRVESNHPGVCGMLYFRDDAGTLMGIYEAIAPNKTLYFPHVHDGEGWRSYFSIMNAGTQNVTVQIEFLDTRTDTIYTRNVTLAPNEKYSGYPTDMLGTDVFFGTIRADSEMPLVGMLNFRSGNLLGTYSTIAPNETLFFPHVHHGSGWVSYFSVMNTGSTTNVQIKFYNNTGGLIYTKSVTLNKNEKFSDYPKNVLGSDFIGTIKVESSTNQPLIGMLNFRDSAKNIFGTYSTTNPKTTIHFPYVKDRSGWVSYFSVMNVGSSSASVTIKFYDNNGSLVHTESISLAPNQKFSDYPSDLVGSEFEGTIIADSDKPIIGMLNLRDDAKRMFGSYTAG